MTYVGAFCSEDLSGAPSVVEYDYLNNMIEALKRAGQESRESSGYDAESEKTPIERHLSEIQKSISNSSMHLPQGFATGLRRQFANLMDEDAWEEDDELPNLDALSTLLNMLFLLRPSRRPGIGTNGRGSITAFWHNNNSRLTVDCLPSGMVSWVLTVVNDNGSRERAAGECTVSRLAAVLSLYDPRIWFG